jgi:hypothetical protein
MQRQRFIEQQETEIRLRELARILHTGFSAE